MTRYANHPLPGNTPWPAGGQPAGQVNEEPAPRQEAVYGCAEGHDFTRTFAAAAEPPLMWDCPRHGHPGLLGGAAEGGVPGKKGRDGKSHWDLLRERRSLTDLDVTLTEALAGLRASRAGVAR